MSPAFSLVVAALVVAGGQALPSRLGGDTVDPQDGKIVGGTESTIERFPYQIAMHNNDRFRCGGSILNENYILTAAHCINTLTGTYALAVRAGSSDRRAGGQYIRVAKMSYHSKFREATMSYDVAILKLVGPLTFNNLVKPVELVAVGNEPKTGTTLTLSGWGVTKSGSNSIPETLRTVDVKVKSRVQCRIPYLILLKWVTDEMICAAAGGKDTCQGDSGGPAVNEEGKQVGIVSFGAGCAFWPFNGVYTNVANKDIRAFIDDRLQNL